MLNTKYVLIGFLAFCNLVTAVSAQVSSPNVVLIMADDVGIECFGCYGSEEYKTPHLDQMAAKGMRFANCHSNPLCTPSRVKLMTGKSNIRNYFDFSLFPKEEPTIGNYFQQAGYRTLVSGKWQLFGAENYKSWAGKGIKPPTAGFDEYCLWQIEVVGSRYWNPLLDINGELKQFEQDDYGPDICVDAICDFISRSKEENERFFVYYPMILPHNPFEPTPLSEDRQSTKKKKNFIDMVQYVDHLIGRIAKHVDEAGLAKETLILFVSDNGTNQSITSSFEGADVQGGKGKTLDTGTHVPMIAYWPGVVPAGRVCDDLIDLADFAPTLADITSMELDPQQTIDGISFAPQLFGDEGTPREWIYCFYHPRPRNKNQLPITFARDKQWKLYDDGRLFDVKADPAEATPFTTGTDDDAAKLARDKLQKALASMPDKPQRLNLPKQ